MNIVLLSGGSGKRLWPLSNDIRSKQFIKIFKTEDGQYESMVQRVYRQIRTVDPDAAVTVATAKTQVSALHNQLGGSVDICVEPCRRDTFPAIVLAASYLRDRKKQDEHEIMIVCPVDPYVELDYFRTIQAMEQLADKGEANMALMGIEPDYPSESYGYIIPESKEAVSWVRTFKEKPTAKKAEEYIRDGALWNGGVFAFRIGYVLEKAHQLIDFLDYEDLYEKYETLEKISFDYAVAEKEQKLQVVRFGGQWKDIGTWNMLTEQMSDPSIGKAIDTGTCENTNIINELNVPVLCVGLKNLVVSASTQGILVADKKQTGQIKTYVDQLDQQVMFAEKSWGNFQVLDVGEDSMTIKITLNPGHSMIYHSHERRDEVWIMVSGHGRVIVDEMEQPVKPGDVVTMEAGCRHTVIADTGLKLIEIQLGREISVYDKQKFRLER